MNKTAVRKLVRAIYYRLADRKQWSCIPQHVRDLKGDLKDELPEGDLLRAVEAFDRALRSGMTAELIAMYSRVVALLPPITYGELTAGSWFVIPGVLEMMRKTKSGVEVGWTEELFLHLPADYPIMQGELQCLYHH